MRRNRSCRDVVAGVRVTPRRNRTWTPGEDRIIRDTMALPLAEVAAKLPGRTAKAVSNRRQMVRGTRKPRVTQPPTPPRGRPHWLIAKTCPVCGRFLPADQFPGRARGGRAHTCDDCITGVTRAYSDRDLTHTRPIAHHHYERWTDREADIITATDDRGHWVHTAREAAVLIGRTSAAVQGARSIFRRENTPVRDEETAMPTPQWWHEIDDPMDRYRRAGRAQADAEAVVTRLSDLRARCLAELHVDGWSYARIAEATGISRARVQQLVERGRDIVVS